MRRHVQRLVLLPPLSALCFAGCASQPVALVPRASTPASIWVCQVEPPLPPAEGFGDADLANWIVSVLMAGRSCRDQLRAAREIVEGKTK
jgi:hypothetical protein